MFKLNRKALATELGLLVTTAERKTTMPILSTVKFDFDGSTLTLTATDIDTTITTEIAAVGEPWAGCVPLKQLLEIVRLGGEDELEFKPEPNERVTVRWGKSRHKLPVQPAEQFPETECAQVGMVAMDGDVLKTAVSRALRCLSPDSTSRWMHGVSFCSRDGAMMVTGTNGGHLATTSIPTILDVDLILPTRAAIVLTKFLEGEVQVGANENQMIFRQGARVFAARLLDAQFPDWRPLVPVSFKHSFTLDSDVASQALKLAAVTAKEFALVPIPLFISLSQKELIIETRESEIGQSVEILPIDCPTLNGDKLTIGVNGQHFISFVDLESDPVIAFNDDLRLFQLSVAGEASYRYITMTLKA